MMINEQAVKDRITELTAAREKYIVEANQQVAMFNAAIAELTQWVNTPPPPPVKDYEEKFTEEVNTSLKET
jgi:hypothetical protein